MGVLKFLGKFFGSFLIILALTIIFTGITIQYSVENLNVISESAEENFPRILEENKEELLSAVAKNENVNKASMRKSCIQSPDEIPEDFCNRLESMTEEEATKAFADVIVLKLQNEYTSELGEGFKQEVEDQLKETLFLDYMKYATPLGLLIFILGSLLVFIAEKFAYEKSLSYTCWKTGVISGIVMVTHFLMKNITSEKVEGLLNELPMIKSEEEGVLAVKLMSGAFTDWIRVIATKMFYISLIITVLSFLIILILFVLKRKLKKKEEKPKKESLEEKVGMVEEKKTLKSKKKKKFLSKKKK